MTKTLVPTRPPAAPPALSLDALDPAARARLTAAFARAGAAVREAKAALAADLVAVARELSDSAAVPAPAAVSVTVVPVKPAAGAAPASAAHDADDQPRTRDAILRVLAADPAAAVSSRAIAAGLRVSPDAVRHMLVDLWRLGRVTRTAGRPPFLYRLATKGAPAAPVDPRPDAAPVTRLVREVLAAGPASPADIQARTGRPMATVTRVLYDMRTNGSARREPDGRYTAASRAPARDTRVWRVLEAVNKAGAAGLTSTAAAAAVVGPTALASAVTSAVNALCVRGLIVGVSRREAGDNRAVAYAVTVSGREVLAGRAPWPPPPDAARPVPRLAPAATLRVLRALAARPAETAAGDEIVAAPGCRAYHVAVAVRCGYARRLRDGRYQLTPSGRAAVEAADRAAAEVAR